MSAVATEPIPESYPTCQNSDSLYGERMLAQEYSQDIRNHYLRTNLPRTGVVRGFFDSQDAENDYEELKYTTSSTTLEDELRSVDLFAQYLAESETIWAEAQKMHQAYAHRIEELRRFASEDDECSDIGKSSREDFWWFVKSVPLAKRAELVLMDNGNLRAVWKGGDKTHIGLQFLGSQLGEYVIFKRRPGAKKVSRVAGIDTLEGLKKQVRAFDINIALLDKE